MNDYCAFAVRETESRKNQLASISSKLWDLAEIRFQEWDSADLLCRTLEEEGFTVERGVAGLPTAFTATYGSGHPVIGFLGEYDALPRLGQEAGIAVKEPRSNGNTAGHGCGHHLLGTALLGAAIVMKEYLRSTGKPGTVVYYGCPAEEGGSGKLWMAMEHVFDPADLFFSWHPSNISHPSGEDILASVVKHYHFHGIASHAAMSPHLGRSALDAAELMNIGVNFLREHIIQEARVHYAFTDAGGSSPNIVHPETSLEYQIRAPKIGQAAEIAQRVDDIARGAALMTGTTVDIECTRSSADLHVNHVINAICFRYMQDIGAPQPDEEDIALAKALYDTLPVSTRGNCAEDAIGDFPEDGPAIAAALKDKVLVDFIYPGEGIVRHYGASSDVGDASQLKPTAFINMACFVKDIPLHSWQTVAFGKTHFAVEGMLKAAEVMGAAAIELVETPALVESAKAEFEARAAAEPYISVTPASAKPAVPQRK